VPTKAAALYKVICYYLGHNKLKKANLDQVLSESRSGKMAHKNKKRISAVTHYVFAFCACGWGSVLFRNCWAGELCFYVFMFPENEPMDTAK
jgi:hypothetical protein